MPGDFLRISVDGRIKLLFIFLFLSGCQAEKEHKDWKVYKSDAASSSYSKLSQINKQNVDQLEVAWKYRTGDIGENSHSSMETNPIIVDDILYGASPHLKIFAVGAATGKEKWMFDPFKGHRSGGIIRSVVYWEEGNDKRILFTAGDHLFALDAKTGHIIHDFGQQGMVSLKKGLGIDPEKISVRASSPGIVYDNLLILGSSVGEGYDALPGYVRAYNIKTGMLEWTFHTIPKPGEPGYETWPKDAWKYIGGVNAWAGMSLDKKRGFAFLPLGSPAYDFYGGHRIGKNLYGNCLVALDVKTGKHIWHFQTVHHDLWDYDLPAPPNLVTVERGGKQVDAVAQITKTGFVFLLDRETGKPLFPVEERNVPLSNVEGEEAWPTQPFPQKPKPFVRQHLTKEEVTNISTEAHDSVLEKLNDLESEGLFTPPSTAGTVNMPGSRGGGDWGGAAYDPDTHLLYINGNESPEIATIKKIKQENKTAIQTVYGRGKRFYMRNCATCHGVDRQGKHPTYPSLIAIKKRMNGKEVLSKIKRGGSMMPAFADISKDHAREIIDYLFGVHKENSLEKTTDGKGKKDNDKDSVRFVNITAHGYFKGPGGHPAVKPLWGTLSAINLNTGEYKWKIPFGTEPSLEKKGISPTGSESWGGPIVTAGGLLFIGATKDQKFRAYDKKTGKLLWETTLPTGGFATPATYLCEGKQYVVIAVGGGRGTPSGDYYIAYALPD